MPVLREALLKVSRSEAIKYVLTRAPVTRRVVDRFVAGETTEDVAARRPARWPRPDCP